MAAPVGMSIQFDLPISVTAFKTFRASGASALDRSSMNGSNRRKPKRTRESARTTCSTMERSFKRNVMLARLAKV